MRTLETLAPGLALALLVPASAGAATWKAQAKGGLVSTTGNAETTTLTVGANASRTDDGNKFTLDGLVAWGRSGILVVVDDGDGVTQPGEIFRETRTTANAWTVKARYDRTFAPKNGFFLAALAGADAPGGKDLVSGAQAGYARRLWQTGRDELVLEAGYDFSYEDYSAPGAASAAIHSARLFLGDTVKLADGVGLAASVEMLSNLNEEDAPSAWNPGEKVKPLRDTRVNAKAALTAKVFGNMSLSVGFTLRYDANPAPLPAIAGAPPFAPGFVPFAEEFDTVTDAALIVTFL